MDSRSMKLIKVAQLNQPMPIINQKYQTRKKMSSTDLMVKLLL